MGGRQADARLGPLATVVVWVIVFGIVATVAGLIAQARADAERADYAARSGSVEVPLAGEMSSDEVTVVSAVLTSDAESYTTTMTVKVTAGPAASNRNPPIRITTATVTCQTTRAWLWDLDQDDLPMECDRHLQKDELDGVGSGVVEIGR